MSNSIFSATLDMATYPVKTTKTTKLNLSLPPGLATANHPVARQRMNKLHSTPKTELWEYFNGIRHENRRWRRQVEFAIASHGRTGSADSACLGGSPQPGVGPVKRDIQLLRQIGGIDRRSIFLGRDSFDVMPGLKASPTRAMQAFSECTVEDDCGDGVIAECAL